MNGISFMEDKDILRYEWDNNWLVLSIPQKNISQLG
jgi:hypothetical protein